MARTLGGRLARLRGPALAALAAAAIVAAARPAQAAEPRGSFEARVGLLRFDYEERDPLTNAFLDGEEGFVPAVTVAGELRLDRFFTRAMLRFAKGSVDYDGHVQSSDPNFDGLPLRTTTDASFLQGELEAGGFVDPGERVALFAAFGARRWGRDIQGALATGRNGAQASIAGLSETYTWYELQAGVRWTFLSLPRTSWDVEARLVRTFGANISVDLSPFGGPSSLDMGLGSRTGWRVGSTLRQDLGRGALFLVATLWAEGYAFGRSDVNTTFGILEPDSSTVNAALELGLGAHF